MAACFKTVSERWKSCFGTDYPFTEAEHVLVFEMITSANRDIGVALGFDTENFEGNPAGVDKCLAVVGLLGFYSGFGGFMLAVAPEIWKDRNPEYRAQAQSWILNAPRAGCDTIQKSMREDPTG